ncbi:MAG: hypothetical protein C6P37_00165 [Caldibacillus debilis]|uniref:Uncharacterized protein n=1 Tax=Caldibacillus debilis TaxID=301148 RepID=A0A3E0K8S2_9BACI|nr:MAG: hypothetical protein C6P37_00165 [Caldibacillus debilis]
MLGGGKGRGSAALRALRLVLDDQNIPFTCQIAFGSSAGKGGAGKSDSLRSRKHPPIQGRRRGKENAKNRAKHGPASDKLISFLKGFCVFTERKKGSLRFFRPIPFPYPSG